MRQPIFAQEGNIPQIRIDRPGSDGYALFRMVIDPERGDSTSAILGVHEHPAGIESIVPHCHAEVEETVFVVAGQGIIKLGWDAQAMEAHSFRPGSCWYVPPGCYHQIVNTGSNPVKMVVSYFRNDGRPIHHRLVSEQLTVVEQAR